MKGYKQHDKNTFYLPWQDMYFLLNRWKHKGFGRIGEQFTTSLSLLWEEKSSDLHKVYDIE